MIHALMIAGAVTLGFLFVFALAAAYVTAKSADQLLVPRLFLAAVVCLFASVFLLVAA